MVTLHGEERMITSEAQRRADIAFEKRATRTVDIPSAWGMDSVSPASIDEYRRRAWREASLKDLIRRSKQKNPLTC